MQTHQLTVIICIRCGRPEDGEFSDDAASLSELLPRLRATLLGGLEPGSSKTRVKAGLESCWRSCLGVLIGLCVI